MTTCISGRILQIKSLIASKFVYRFQLLPTPKSEWFFNMEQIMVNHVWEQARHRISKAKMIAPKQKGGFNMLDMKLQEASLKLRWIDRLLMDRVNISFGFPYTMSAFKISIINALRCNISPKKIKNLLHRPILQVWHDIFTLWFSLHYIPITCTERSKRSALLNSLFCFCEPVSKIIKRFGGDYNEVMVYEILLEHHILTWADFLINFNNLITMKPVYPDLPMLLIRIKANIPSSWKELFGMVDWSNHLTRLHTVDHCLEGRFTVKNWYNRLVESKYKVNDSAIVQWTVDLKVEGIPANWEKICTKLLVIRNPKLQDFGRSFLHRSYYMNPRIATFNPEVSEECTFCKKVSETILHLFWECSYAKALWLKVTTFVFENISDDVNMDMYHCLLSDFDCHVLVLLSVIVKYRIHLSRLNGWKPSYVQVLKELR